MLNTRRTGAGKVAAKLFSSEDAIDTAIATTAELAATMLAVRQDVRLSAVMGQDALESVMASCSALIQARRSIVDGHHALSAVQREIGLGEVAFGGLVEKGPRASGLTVIESVAA